MPRWCRMPLTSGLRTHLVDPDDRTHRSGHRLDRHAFVRFVDPTVDREGRTQSRRRASLRDERITDDLHLVAREPFDDAAKTVRVERIVEAELTDHLEQRHPV